MSETDEFRDNRDLGGNTKVAPKSQVNQLLHWCFTWNNYISNDIETIETLFNHLCHKYCFQEETGVNGTHHLQGVISLNKKMRWSEFGLPKSIHWEKTKCLTQSYLYCSKVETRTGNVYTKNYNVPKPLKLIEPTYEWQIKVLENIKEEPNDRIVYWYWSKAGGIGKSQFCKYLVAKHKAIFIDEGKKGDIMKLIFDSDMDKSNLVIIDVPRDNGNNISYKSVESIKNGMIYSSKYEGGYKLFNSPHVLIFANEEPKFNSLSLDRWIVIELV